MTQNDTLADDLMVGAKPIAKFIFGNDDKKSQRRVYHLAENAEENRLPFFWIGVNLAARKSELLEACSPALGRRRPPRRSRSARPTAAPTRLERMAPEGQP